MTVFENLPVARQNSTLVCLARAFPTEWTCRRKSNKFSSKMITKTVVQWYVVTPE